ncbi:MAG: amidohydrolase family protein [Janthinobacterium lividum]
MALLHLIEQILVVGLAGKAPQQMDVLVEADKFVAIAPRIDVSSVHVDERTDGRGKMMMAGLVNAHHHSHDRFDKGRFAGLPLEIWMGLYNPPTHARRWSPRDVYLRTLINAIEMLKGGITTIVDDIHFGAAIDPESVYAAFQAYSDLGVRAEVSVAWSDRPFHEGIPYLSDVLAQGSTPSPTAGWSSNSVLDFWRELARSWGGRVRFVLSPSGPQRCTTEFLQRTWDIAAQFDLPVLIHVLETRIQALTAQKMYGGSMVAYLNEHGLLNRHSVLAHGVWLTLPEMDLLARSQASVIHNPACNLKLGSGIAPIGELLKRGVNVGLGTDNNNGNDLNSMFDALRMSALLSGIGRADADASLSADQAFELATSNGARALGRDALTGTIEVGKQADFVVLDLNSASFLPLNEPMTQLVFCEQGQSVLQVYVGGRRLIDRGRVARIDEAALRAELAERLPAISAAIAAAEHAAAELRPSLLAAYRRCVEDPLMQPWLSRINAIQR